MTDYTQATDQQLRQAKSMAEYDIQRYAKTHPIEAEAAQRVRLAVRAEPERRR